MHLFAAASTFEIAKVLRANPTPEEKILWHHLRNKQLEGVKFRRQHPLYKYVADFYAHEIKLIVELDGSLHQEPAERMYDQERSSNLKKFDVTVLRFENRQVRDELDLVLEKIKSVIQEIRSNKVNGER